jgi:hypothetical protein
VQTDRNIEKAVQVEKRQGCAWAVRLELLDDLGREDVQKKVLRGFNAN